MFASLRKIFIHLLLVFSFGHAAAQTSLKKKISRPEKIWALTHPFAAKKAFRLTKRVVLICDSLKKIKELDGIGNGDQLDAFRHAYWMALLTQHMSSNKVYRLGLAHERGNELEFKKNKMEDNIRPDSMGCVMDIINDQIGIDIGLAIKKEKAPESDQDLIGEIIGNVKDGNLQMLAKNKNDDFLDCDGNIIHLAEYKGKWGIPKCLIKSFAVPIK